MLIEVNVGEAMKFKNKTIGQLPPIHMIFLMRFLGKQTPKNVR